MEEVLEIIKKTHVYYLATVDGNQARVRPMGSSYVRDGKLYVFMGRAKDVARQILANPNVETCAYDTESGTWVRVTGKLLEELDPAAREAILADNPSMIERYTDPAECGLFYFADAVARFDSFSGEPTYVNL